MDLGFEGDRASTAPFEFISSRLACVLPPRLGDVVLLSKFRLEGVGIAKVSCLLPSPKASVGRLRCGAVRQLAPALLVLIVAHLKIRVLFVAVGPNFHLKFNGYV